MPVLTIVIALALLAQASSTVGHSISLSTDGQLAYSSVQEEDRIYVISIPERKIAGVYDTPKGTGPDPVIPLR